MKAEYISHMGDDLAVVNDARVSFDKASNALTEKDKRLIGYLARNGHWTPFAHSFVKMRLEMPIFMARQMAKHVVGFVTNEVSRRYVDAPPTFYEPDEWRARPEGSVKQGSGEAFDNGFQDAWNGTLNNHHRYCLETYNDALKEGIAPEQARMVLPQSMNTSMTITASLAAWARAYKQRSDPHSQKEMQQMASLWAEIIEPLFPVSWKALIA